jgi:4'-phosphopantetheinyl transferase
MWNKASASTALQTSEPPFPGGRRPWPAPPPDIVLNAGSVHVWCASSDLDPLPFEGVLSKDERSRCGRLRFERDRLRFVVQHGLLRVLLGRYLGLEPAKLRFVRGPQGKPELTGLAPDKFMRFSLSHSDDIVLFAFCRCSKVGVDVERVRPLAGMDGMARQVFSEAEQAFFERVPEAGRLQTFFRAWTRKEACLKATGEGISGMAGMEVSLIPGDPPRVRSVPPGAGTAEWSLHDLCPAAGFVGALAVQGKCPAPDCWAWAN